MTGSDAWLVSAGWLRRQASRWLLAAGSGRLTD
jgi:hypothetical protein